jgi:hypothetical protein
MVGRDLAEIAARLKLPLEQAQAAAPDFWRIMPRPVMLGHLKFIGTVRLDRRDHQTGAELVIDESSIHIANFLYPAFAEISDPDSSLLKFPPAPTSYVRVRVQNSDNDFSNTPVDQPETAGRLFTAKSAWLQR